MFPSFCFSLDKLLPRKKKGEDRAAGTESDGWDVPHCPSVVYSTRRSTRFPLRTERRDRKEEIEVRKRVMANKVSNISDLIHRVASSCLTNHPAAACGLGDGGRGEIDEEDDSEVMEREELDDGDDGLGIWEEEEEEEKEEKGVGALERLREMEGQMAEVFEAVSSVKRAYVCLQEAHSPWDPDKMRAADAAVVAELRRLGRLRDRFRRSVGGGAATATAATPLREAVAPYEAALDELRREIKTKEAEVENLKEKLRSTTPRSTGKKGRPPHGKRVGCITALAPPAVPTSELFETYMEEVKSASKTFTGHLLSLMRAARWDIAAAVRSIVEGDGDGAADRLALALAGVVEPGHAKYALESYVNRRVFHGFENETFYMDGTLTSLLNPPEFRRDCFAQFRDMRGMDPAELLGILPTCHFGRFAGKKYLAVVHPKMEESLFGGAEQRRQVVAGAHPRTGFYAEFLRLAKAVWLLHLLAFALDPAPSHFEASKGADFHPNYMESIVRFAGGRVPSGSVVGFSVSPGFKLGNRSVVRARVYLVPRAL